MPLVRRLMSLEMPINELSIDSKDEVCLVEFTASDETGFSEKDKI